MAQFVTYLHVLANIIYSMNNKQPYTVDVAVS